MTSTPAGRSPQVSNTWSLVTLALLAVFAVSCGGGGGGSQSPPPPPSPDFTLTLNPASLTIVSGESGSLSVSANSLNGFSSDIAVQITGLPSGVTASPATLTVAPGGSQAVTFSVANGTAATTATAKVTGTAASLSHNVNLSISVAGTRGTLSTRTRYVRTDAVIEYYLWLNTHWEVFNPPTHRFFVTDPFSNQIFVFDSVSETKIGTIPVPGAFGIDDTPDHTTLYVGTMIGDVYAIDPVAMRVKQRYRASQIGPYGFEAWSALVLADGRLALLGAQGGIPSVDGSSSIAIWNPVDNSIDVYGAGMNGAPPHALCPMGNIGGFARTGDRTGVLLGSIDSDGTLCELIPSTGELFSAGLGGFVTMNLFPSPDGRYVVVRGNSNQANFYDAHTLLLLFSINLAGSTDSGTAFTFSADSRTLYFLTDGFVYAYDIASKQLIGWLPNMLVEYTSGGLVVGPVTSPNYEAIDGTGLLAGPLEEGFGFLDTTQLRTGPLGTGFSNAYLSPATGPVSGGTQTQWDAATALDSQSTIYFGGKQALPVSRSGGFVSVTTPPGAPGPVDVYALAKDGGMQLIPDAFSYGPSILEVTPDMATTDGGAIGSIYGYGFAPMNATVIPSDLSVTVGGQSALITALNLSAYNLASPPFLLQAIYYRIPPGATGTADVVVTTASGKAHSSLTYLFGSKQFPLPGAALVQGVYDPARDVYYFTDANKIQVFSLTQQKWLAPIAIPAPVGTTQRLWGISLSPDGSKLAIADEQALVVYLLDPASPATVKTFPIAAPIAQGIINHPVGVAVSNSGNVYLTIFVEGGTGFSSFFKLNTTNGTLTDYHVTGPQFYVDGFPQDVYLKTAISSDNSRAFFNNDGFVFTVDTASDQLFFGTVGQGCCYGNYELSLSPNQTRLTATNYIYDSDMNGESYYTVNDREYDVLYVYGAKLSPDGGLLFQPSANGTDIYDARLGMLRHRVALPYPLSPNYDALVQNDKDNTLLAIIGNNGDGIAILDFNSMAEPSPLPYNVKSSTQPRTSRPQIWGHAMRASSARGYKATARGGTSSPRRAVPHINHSSVFSSR